MKLNTIFPSVTNKGNLTTTFTSIIPFLVFVSKSVVTNPNNEPGGAAVYTLHITPLIAIGLVWRA